MTKKKIKNLKYHINKAGIELNKLESLARIMTECILSDTNLKSWDNENLSYIFSEKLFHMKKQLNKAEKILEI